MTENHITGAPAPASGGRPAGTREETSGYVEDDHSSSSPAGPLLVGAGLVAVGVVLLSQVWAINADGFSPEGPRFFPLVVLTLLTLLGGIYLGQQVLALTRRQKGHPAERFDHMPAAGVLLALLVAYAFVLAPVGYVLATSAFVVGAARTMGSRNLVRDVVVGVGLSLLVYLTFTRALGVFLPEGVLPL